LQVLLCIQLLRLNLGQRPTQEIETIKKTANALNVSVDDLLK